MTEKELKGKLDELEARYNVPAFVDDDPVQFPRMFSTLRDIEVAAVLVATITWGGRRQIISACRRLLFTTMGGEPYRFVMERGADDLPEQSNVYRTFFVRDLQYICRGLRAFYSEHESLEPFFVQGDMWQGLYRFRQFLCSANEGMPSKHVSNPGLPDSHRGAACKRLHLMLRWLCRRDGVVDLGVWRKVEPRDLKIPLDVRVARASRRVGLLTRLQNDRMAVEELTGRLREFCPDDPIKYDFALFGLGE